MIQNALKVEQQRSEGVDMRPSTRTFADSEGHANSTVGPDRFKSHFTAGTNEPGDIQAFSLKNQNKLGAGMPKDDRLTVNAFNQENTGALQAEVANYRNQTVSPNQLPNMIAGQAHLPNAHGEEIATGIPQA